jgi:predicted DNA-binding antitoxin AbrB/MazE fold protein
MSIQVSAVYENGVFRPTGAIRELPNGTPVTLTIETSSEPEVEEPNRRRTPKEVREFIRAANPDLEFASEEWHEETKRLIQMAYGRNRDPEIMRQGAESMDRLSEQIYKREGLLDIAVPLLRESRDEE